jgi:hypothetical protein
MVVGRAKSTCYTGAGILEVVGAGGVGKIGAGSLGTVTPRPPHCQAVQSPMAEDFEDYYATLLYYIKLRSKKELRNNIHVSRNAFSFRSVEIVQTFFFFYLLEHGRERARPSQWGQWGQCVELSNYTYHFPLPSSLC